MRSGINPADPKWLNRDRFVLSAGHGSMFLYCWLHLSGYASIDLDQVKHFRALGSHTPGHPEFHETPGVEATTGPLGQGVANAVGYAVSQKMAAARFNTAEHTIFDHHIVCLAGDGCMQEGVAMEAIAFAGHFKLDNLILIYDSNDVTLDAMADATQSEDAAKRFEAIDWDVQTVDGHDIAGVPRSARKGEGRDGQAAAHHREDADRQRHPGSRRHGEGARRGRREVRRRRAQGPGAAGGGTLLREPGNARVLRRAQAKLAADYDAWQKTYAAWRAANPELAAELDAARDKGRARGPARAASRSSPPTPRSPPARPAPTCSSRRASGAACSSRGSADLHGSTLNYINSSKDFTPDNRSGRNIRFGIREHGMCGIMNGIAYDGIFRASGATFLVFADYCRASIRLAALSGLPTIYIFTHDSVGVGEDGPTHQPVETVSGLRVIPNLDVIRPADPEETAGAFAAAIDRTDGPTLLALTRQAVPMLNDIPVQTRREGVLKGGYIALQETGDLRMILLGAGSELQHAMAAAEATRRRRARGQHALLRALRSPAAELPRRRAPAVLPPARRHRGRRHRPVVEIRRARRARSSASIASASARRAAR